MVKQIHIAEKKIKLADLQIVRYRYTDKIER